MGFGYLFLGYLIAFLLQPVADALGVAFVALLLGYVTMLYALRMLKRYCPEFALAQWSLYPLLLLGGYHTLENLSELFLWRIPFVTEKVTDVITYVEFGLILVFHALLLWAVWTIGRDVELKRIETAAIRNFIIVMLYAAVAIVYFVPISAFASIKNYLGLSVAIMKLIYPICNLCLFLSCAKNICAEGEDDLEPKRYRWELLNRLGDSFSRNFQRAADRNRSDMEDYLRKKQGNRQRKNAELEIKRQSRKQHKKKK